MNWQPIETAPRDGTWILGCNDRGNQAVIIWSERGLDSIAERGVRPGWVFPFSEGRLSPFWEGLRVVYWQPLPLPPGADVMRLRQRERMQALSSLKLPQETKTPC